MKVYEQQKQKLQWKEKTMESTAQTVQYYMIPRLRERNMDRREYHDSALINRYDLEIRGALTQKKNYDFQT